MRSQPRCDSAWLCCGFRWTHRPGSVVTLERLASLQRNVARPAQGLACLHARNRWSHCHGRAGAPGPFSTFAVGEREPQLRDWGTLTPFSLGGCRATQQWGTSGHLASRGRRPHLPTRANVGPLGLTARCATGPGQPRRRRHRTRPVCERGSGRSPDSRWRSCPSTWIVTRDCQVPLCVTVPHRRRPATARVVLPRASERPGADRWSDQDGSTPQDSGASADGLPVPIIPTRFLRASPPALLRGVGTDQPSGRRCWCRS